MSRLPLIAITALILGSSLATAQTRQGNRGGNTYQQPATPYDGYQYNQQQPGYNQQYSTPRNYNYGGQGYNSYGGYGQSDRGWNQRRIMRERERERMRRQWVLRQRMRRGWGW